jgi:hypothetical protein
MIKQTLKLIRKIEKTTEKIIKNKLFFLSLVICVCFYKSFFFSILSSKPLSKYIFKPLF